MAKLCNFQSTHSTFSTLHFFSPIEVTAIIQRPSAYLTPVELNIEESFLNVPILRQIELHAINELPTHFHWDEVLFLSNDRSEKTRCFSFQPQCIDKDQCLIEINPRHGTLYHGKPCTIDIIFTAKKCGVLNDDWCIPCYIQNAAQPIFLKMNAIMKGMNVDFRHGEK